MSISGNTISTSPPTLPSIVLLFLHIRMSTQASYYSWPGSMQLESYEAFSEDLNTEICMAESDAPSEFSALTTLFSDGAPLLMYNISTSSDCASVSDEFCQYSDSVSLNNKVVDVGGWIYEMFQDIPSPNQDFYGEASSSPSVQSNCSWVENTKFQPSLVEEAQLSSFIDSSIISAIEVPEQSPGLLHKDLLDGDNRSALSHLMKAFREAIGDKSFTLAKVISDRIHVIGAAMGSTMERLGCYMFQENQNDYIRQESSQISKVASHAFYSLCLANRFVHFIANLTILSSISEDTERIHIVDFDMGEGGQWPPLIEAVGSRKLVRITSLRTSESRFEDTKTNLLEYAESRGLRLIVDEMDMDDIFLEKKRMKKRGGKELMVFNCMVGVPCMGTLRNMSQAIDFLKVSKEIIGIATRGIITFGNGGVGEIGVQRDAGFASYFDECLLHSYALLESLEWHISCHLMKARSAMESLFLAPCISSNSSLAKWEEVKEAYDAFPAVLQEHRLNKETVDLAVEMVKGQGLYEVRGQGSNELILEWRGAPLVKFSSWR